MYDMLCLVITLVNFAIFLQEWNFIIVFKSKIRKIKKKILILMTFLHRFQVRWKTDTNQYKFEKRSKNYKTRRKNNYSKKYYIRGKRGSLKGSRVATKTVKNKRLVQSNGQDKHQELPTESLMAYPIADTSKNNFKYDSDSMSIGLDTRAS